MTKVLGQIILVVIKMHASIGKRIKTDVVGLFTYFIA